MVSSSVRPVKTRMVISFSWAVSVPHDGMSLDTGTFSGNQKLPVSRSQTSASFSSCSRFQLMAETRSISFMPSLTRTPFHLVFLDRSDRAAVPSSTLQLGSDYLAVYDILCFGVSRRPLRNAYSDGSKRRVASQYCHVIPLHSVRLTPCSSIYQLRQPPVLQTVPARSPCNSSLYAS